MLSIGKLACGQDRYYLSLAATDDYYIGPQAGLEPKGIWIPTRAADVLGAKHDVLKEVLQAFFQGFDEAGNPLVQNAGKPTRRPGWDLCFTVPKGLSVLYAVSTSDVQAAIERCLYDAVCDAIHYLEETAAFTRSGSAGCRLNQASLVVPAFLHHTSREEDPTLHVHCLVLNLAYDTEGKWRSIESKFLYNHKMLAGAFFRASLAHYLQANLGIKIVIEGTAFEIDGVPTKLRKALSTRREQIKERLAQVGLHTAAAAAVATLETRKKKDHTQSIPDLLNRWRTIAAQHGFTLERARGLLYRVRPEQDPRAISQTVENAVRSLTHKSMQFSREDLERKALQAAVEKGQHPSNVLQAVDTRLKEGPDVVKLTRDDRDQRYTTAEAKALRVDISQAVRRMDTSKAHPVSQRKIEETIRHFSTPRAYLTEELKHHVREIARATTHQETRPIDRETVARHAKQTLSTEQAQAVRDVLASPGRISVLRHKAVADTDQVLRACRRAWESAGLEVIGASLSNADVERLQRETSIETFSLKGLEVRMSPTLGYRLRHHARQFRRAAQGRSTYAIDPLKIDRNKVLLIDHAERISPDQMAFLTKYVAKQGGKLVLVEGDRKFKKGLAPTAFDDLRKDLNTLRSDPSHSIDNPITAELDRIVRRPSTARQILKGL